jgi:hypothetical protein
MVEGGGGHRREYVGEGMAMEVGVEEVSSVGVVAELMRRVAAGSATERAIQGLAAVVVVAAIMVAAAVVAAIMAGCGRAWLQGGGYNPLLRSRAFAI